MNKGHAILCLDKGHVIYVDHMGSDEDICAAARVSYKKSDVEKTPEENQKLINYLFKNKHTSPFEMGKIVMVIKMPIFVARQYIRHRMQNVNEVSARYTELPDEFYIPDQWRVQDVKNKQGSVAYEGLDHAAIRYRVMMFCKNAYDTYKIMINQGVAREMARMVLPLNIYTEMRVCWDLKNLLHFITLREDAHAQAEIQAYGRAMKFIMAELFPMVAAAYERYKFNVTDTAT